MYASIEYGREKKEVIEVKAIITATAFVFKQMHGIP
jgi:hypothetical protein